MAVTLGVPKETVSGEQRVALVPGVLGKLKNMGAEIAIESGAGDSVQLPDDTYDANIVSTSDAFAADVVLKVAPPTVAEAQNLKEGSVLISFMAAHKNLDLVKVLQERNISSFGMEYIPRITRAQAMDALSSQANIAGYKAVLMGANLLGRYFPMLTTAAGTIRPAKVIIIGAGVAGLQAIATARRLGAIVEAYDVRPETAEQCESLGAKFIDTGVQAAGDGGYARELTDEEKQQQRDVLAQHVAQADVVITTAAIPGRESPKIIFTDMVENMKNGAVIVDLAAEGGGNCELTEAGKIVTRNNVKIYGPLNVPSMLAEHASEMYAKNIQYLLELMIKEGELTLDFDDEVIAGSCLTHAGEVKHAPTAEMLNN